MEHRHFVKFLQQNSRKRKHEDDEFDDDLTLISSGGGGRFGPPFRFFLNNFFSINAIDLKLSDFSYKSILHILAKFGHYSYCQNENIGHILNQPIRYFWNNFSCTKLRITPRIFRVKVWNFDQRLRLLIKITLQIFVMWPFRFSRLSRFSEFRVFRNFTHFPDKMFQKPYDMLNASLITFI